MSLSSDAHSNTPQGYTAVLGKGMLRNNRLLPILLGHSIERWYPWHRLTKRQAATLPQHFAGWGNKKSYRRARRIAQKMQRPVLSIEDGFLRSIDSGIASRYGCSVVVDYAGIYFDVKQTSSLEHHIINRLTDWSPAQAQRAQNAIRQIIDYTLSKYNTVIAAPNLNDLNSLYRFDQQPAIANKTTCQHILVVDQVVGDGSIQGAGANHQHFERMLKTACRNHPQAQIWIKAHPASQQGYLNQPKLLAKLSRNARQRVRVLNTPANAIALLKQVDAVYSVSSHMGFEALILGKKVYCFGVCWYAGWGLTDDSYAPKRLLKQVQKRRLALLQQAPMPQPPMPPSKQRCNNTPMLTTDLGAISVSHLFYAAYIDYSRYADPASNRLCDLEQVIEWLHTNRYWSTKLPKRITVYEFSRWKQGFVADFLNLVSGQPNSSIKVKTKPRYGFLQQSQRLGADLTHDILVWGLAGRLKVQDRLKKVTGTVDAKTATAAPKLWCMEDGFIRSNGLGATLLAPLSVVVDGQGIYYDATKPSDLEQMLIECGPLTHTQSTRVQALQHTLLQQRVSKYHVGHAAAFELPKAVKHRHALGHTTIILIIGQVEDDLSVQYCGSLIKTNTALIERVRQDNPVAYLIFKPHPDVEAGLRLGQVKNAALQLVDAVAHDMAIADCLAVADAVHTISSLAGFEALLRGKKVCCYGLPFYAGWGLTEDKDRDVNCLASHLVSQHPAPSHSVISNQLVQSRATRRRQYMSQQTPAHDPHDPHDPHRQAHFQARSQIDTALSIEQLIYCTLIGYPMYRLPQGYGLAQVEQVIDYLYASSPLEPQADLLPIKPLFRVKKVAKTRFMQLRYQALKVLKKRS